MTSANPVLLNTDTFLNAHRNGINTEISTVLAAHPGNDAPPILTWGDNEWKITLHKHILKRNSTWRLLSCLLVIGGRIPYVYCLAAFHCRWVDCLHLLHTQIYIARSKPHGQNARLCPLSAKRLYA
jgi:hypothetical protein